MIMARQAESCMFCGEYPCICNAAPPKRAAIKKVTPSLPNSPAIVPQLKPVRSGLTAVPRQAKPVVNEDEGRPEILLQALANLRKSFTLVHISDEGLTVEEQIMLWREEREQWPTQQGQARKS